MIGLYLHKYCIWTLEGVAVFFDGQRNHLIDSPNRISRRAIE